jgi:hypothetical protein
MKIFYFCGTSSAERAERLCVTAPADELTEKIETLVGKRVCKETAAGRELYFQGCGIF